MTVVGVWSRSAVRYEKPLAGRDFVTILRRAFAGELVSYDGEVFSVRNFPLDLELPLPPRITIAAIARLPQRRPHRRPPPPSPPGGYYPLYEDHFPVDSLSQLPQFDFPGLLASFDNAVELLRQ